MNWNQLSSPKGRNISSCVCDVHTQPIFQFPKDKSFLPPGTKHLQLHQQENYLLGVPFLGWLLPRKYKGLKICPVRSLREIEPEQSRNTFTSFFLLIWSIIPIVCGTISGPCRCTWPPQLTSQSPGIFAFVWAGLILELHSRIEYKKELPTQRTRKNDHSSFAGIRDVLKLATLFRGETKSLNPDQWKVFHSSVCQQKQKSWDRRKCLLNKK